MEQAGCGYFASKDELAELRSDVKDELAELRSDMNEGFASLREEIRLMREDMNRRFDEIDERFDRSEQNHLDHITSLHAIKLSAQHPKPPDG